MVKMIYIFLLTILMLAPNTSFANSNSYIEDKALILNSEDLKKINNKLTDISKKYSNPAYIYITDENIPGSLMKSSDKKLIDRADGLLRDRVGADNTGILVYINFNTGDIRITLSGKTLSIVDDYRQEKLVNILSKDLRNNTKVALENYINQLDYYLEKVPISGNKIVKEKSLTIFDGLIALALSIVAYFSSYGGLKSSSYIRPSNAIYSLYDNSILNINKPQEDELINSETTTRRIPRNTNVYSGGSSSRGSTTTTHTSSGGGTFSGSSGKF